MQPAAWEAPSLIMKTIANLLSLVLVLLSPLLFERTARAQTGGSARVEVTLLDYNGSGTKHWTVVWVTTSSGAFLKTLRKQGPSIGASHWNSHCREWYNAKAGSTALDGYSSATAADYKGTNSPVICTWNGRDANNNLVPDGQYKFWVQYAEDNGQGPFTSGGLSWVKGPAGATNTYPNQGAHFASMRVTWTPDTPPPVAPTIVSAPPTAEGTVGVPYSFACTATGTTPIAFGSSGLPPGLSISPGGLISGTPTTAGTYTGNLTAANGTLPNASQSFGIVIGVVPARFTGVRREGSRLTLDLSGPANGVCTLLSSINPTQPGDQWTLAGSGTFDALGQLSFTNAIEWVLPSLFYRLRVP